MELSSTDSKEQFLSGGGEMGKLIRTMDWSKTALGPIEVWPQSLRTSVSLCLSSTFPILIAWGTETIQIYNDSYRPICGAKHPESMGMNFRICWETALAVVGDAFTRGQKGEGTYINDQRMFLDRYGYLEEAWMTFSFAPIRDESGGVGGIFHPITETTVKMLSARRTQELRDLGEAIGKVKSLTEIGRVTTELYEDYVLDIPFLLIYEINHQNGKARLISNSGLPAGTGMAPLVIDLHAHQDRAFWPVTSMISSDEIQEVADLRNLFGTFNCEPYDISPSTAMLIPLRLSGQEELFGFIIAGVSACRALDTDYRNFYNLLGNTFNTAISNVYAYEQEQKRAEALAAIDRSKTAFFGNVSHEFRTPLTLMLGPLEDLLAKADLDVVSRSSVEVTHRNALRLLKLVNNLLDYSRVEAGRVQATYQRIDMCELTTDLTSSFRSIIEKAGMKLMVDCQPTKDDFFVDQQMWEKIVLNLLSNAFKYTLEGTISVSLAQEGRGVILKVSDTGVGIPEKEIPHMFERFHRVENSAGRTHEGTGIGLSLVHELVHLHGGEITVESVEGAGSTFIIHIPVGKYHLPQENVIDTKRDIDSTALKSAFIQEAYSLLQDEGKQIAYGEILTQTGDVSGHKDFSEDKETNVLIVDDNGDMRAYLKRLLEPYFTITTAVNGSEALDVIKKSKQHLVLSDVMMPVMDGKTMIKILRDDPATRRIPIIFLSARAGNEARIDGLEVGADDYLIKPFSSAELLTKIRAQINITKVREEANIELQKANDTLKLAMEASGMGLWRTEWGTDELLVSDRARHIHAIPLGIKLSFDETLEVVVPEHRERLQQAILNAVAIKGGFRQDYQIQPLDGSKLKWLSSTGKVELDEKGEVKSVIGTILDITESKEDEIRKNDFIGMVSHELKTPLTSLNGYTQLLQMNARKKEDNFALEKLEKMTNQFRKMTALINGFLNLSRLESGKIQLHKNTFEINTLIEEMIEETELHMTAHRISFHPGPTTILTADRDKIGSVLSNLLGNAIKYSPNGTPIIVSSNFSENTMTVSIKDQGFGIKQSDQAKLFDRYYRVANHQNISGFGIGLYLSAEIIERHDGKIWVESELGEGSDFKFLLPIAL
ncbi:ATP-binding protein [Mucilaginibacter flavidus]|uniref:ATP-binding protein n=1 Tax=Mucilaginibacter flavidus TaxID=2949309 RepID=UPI002092C1D6|nr:ATP-binding protein [Mucilaginibacter flavidus]MCO5951098.1 ATP-binding protein [Mucilaginibacter flavidus]